MNKPLIRYYLTIIPCCALVILWGFSIAGDIPHFFLNTAAYHYSNTYFRPAAFLSNIAGLLLSGYLCDKFGRKLILHYATLALCLVLGLLLFFEHNLNIFLVRMIINLFIGAIYVASLTYIVETAPTKHRGRAVVVMRLFIALGTLFTYFLDYVVIYTYHGMTNIKVLSVFCFLLLFWILSQFTPESFRWLSIKGKIEEALAIFDRFNSENKYTEAEISCFTSSDTPNHQLKDFYISKPLRNRFILISLIFIIIAFTQVTSIIQFAPFIIQKSSVQLKFDNVLLSLLLAFVYLCAISVSFFLIDRIGRRRLVIFGVGGMIISYVFSNILISLFLGNQYEFILLVLRPFLMVGFFGLGASAVLNLFSAEFFSTSIRARAVSFTTTILLLMVAFNKLIFFFLIEYLGLNGFFNITSIFAIVALILIAEFIPETNNKILEKIAA